MLRIALAKGRLQEDFLELIYKGSTEGMNNRSLMIKDAKRKGKQVSWADLSTDARYAIQAELLNAHTNKNKNDLSGDEYTINKTASYILQKKIKNKNIVESINESIEAVNEYADGLNINFSINSPLLENGKLKLINEDTDFEQFRDSYIKDIASQDIEDEIRETVNALTDKVYNPKTC